MKICLILIYVAQHNNTTSLYGFTGDLYTLLGIFIDFPGFHMQYAVFCCHAVVFLYSSSRMTSSGVILFLSIRCFEKFSVILRKLGKCASDIEFTSRITLLLINNSFNHLLL